MKNFNYTSPLSYKYGNEEISKIWSLKNRYFLWRKLWLSLARAEKNLGLNITEEQLEEMQNNLENINLDDIKNEEILCKHEVIANINIFGKLCKKAKPIIHLGATSCYVMDNADLIQIKDSLNIIRKKIIFIIKTMSDLAVKHSDMPMLGYTHYQPAQIITFGKRLCTYIQDFIIDFNKLNDEYENLLFRGAKGAIGTQSSFLYIFNGDHDKVKQLDEMIAKDMNFDNKLFKITSQTYTRKIDYYIFSVLSGIAQTAYKFANDIRLLSNLNEIREFFSDEQIGSSAMSYKRNPIYSERICSLSRYVINLAQNTIGNYSMQWLERTLDDSANRRIILPEIFILIDYILSLLYKIVDKLDINKEVISFNINNELPLIITENIIIKKVKNGGDRQKLHKLIKEHVMNFIKHRNRSFKDLLNMIKLDSNFSDLVGDDINDFLDMNKLIGRSKEQVIDYIDNDVYKLINKYLYLIDQYQIKNVER